MAVSPERLSRLFALAALVALLWPATAAAQSDEVVFSTYVEPNVLLVLDNSNSMKEIVWHPDFDPNAAYACAAFPAEDLFYLGAQTTLTVCGITRTLYVDGGLGAGVATIYRGKYLNWLFSPASNVAYPEIASGSSGSPSACSGGSSYARYQQTRLTDATRTLQDVICEVNQTTKVRFGLMTFREPDSSTPDVNGGYVIAEIDTYDSGQAADLNSGFQSIKAGTWSPLGESIFQAYTYFMSRTAADLPEGNGPGHEGHAHKFPVYEYKVSTAGVGGLPGPAAQVPDSPVQYHCQKNFIILISAGEPTRDDFQKAEPTNTATGFDQFNLLIGNYNGDLETEVQDDKVCLDCQTALYLDDIAYFMQQRDFRPDLEGDQLIDLYTISLTEDADANDLLRRAAQLGNGTFTDSKNSEELAAAIIAAFNSIVAKAQSFTAATVPASRTSAGGQIYVSQFQPSSADPYWIGHLESYHITLQGEILDKNGNCALESPVVGECFSGPFKETAQPHWNAFDVIPSPGTRKLSASSLAGGTPGKVPFDDTLTDLDLGVVYPPVEVYANSTALNSNGLKDEIVANVRGCQFGTGVLSADVGTPQACVPREAIQGDIFHSNPVVIGQPAAFDPDPSYAKFASNYAYRDRVILAGSNSGFLQGFLAGEWDTTLSPPRHDVGTGVELFGFMPWPARQKIRYKPTDTGNRDYYFVDGSPTASDVWLYTNPTTAPKLADGSEWKTVVVGGMRQGGEAYYALDITDPSDPNYPGYLWEFPREDAPASLKQYIGETWSEPVLTRIKVQVNANDNSGEGFERWVMIVAGGYDPSGDPNNTASYDPTATQGRGIFIVDVKTGEVVAQQVFDPTAPLGDPRLEMLYAIPSSPGVFDLDFDGFADVIYVGDVGGNLWKWVIQPIGMDRVNGPGKPDDQPSWTFRKLFQAPFGTPPGGTFAHYKSFFFAPTATYKGGQLWLAFASGERANLAFEGVLDATGDPVNSDEDNNRFYALKDDDPLEQAAIPQTLADEGQMLALNQSTPDICADASAYRGYYWVGGEGEKYIVNLEIFLGYVFLGSFFPTENLDPCGVAGAGFLSVFRIECGEGFFQDTLGDPEKTISVGAGLPTDPKVSIGNGDGSSDGGNRVIINRQDGGIINFEAPPGFSTFGMFYWREVYQ